MAVKLTRNLKLKVDSNLTANAAYNLQRIDDLAGVFLIDNQETVNVRSKVDINLLPEDPSVGGSGVGGVLNFSSASQLLTQVNVYTSQFNLTSPLRSKDQASGGNKYLQFQYKSDLSGSVDTIADRILSVDLEGANRSIVLAGDFSLLGGNLTLNATLPSNLNLPITGTGTLATLANTETFTNKTIDADVNTLSNIDNNEIKAAAGIVYSKLDLANSIVNADIAVGAAIAYGKLALAASIVNADVNASAAIDYSKLNLAGSIINSDINSSANIHRSKLFLTGLLTNSDITGGAAIDGSKINPDFVAQNIKTSGQLQLFGPLFKTAIQAAQSGQASDLLLTLPSSNLSGVLVNDGSGNLSWISVTGTGTVTSVDMTVPSAEFSVSGNPITTSGTLAISKAVQSANTVWAGPTSGGSAQPSFRSIVAADLPANTLIDVLDSSSIDFSISGNQLSGAVLPGGVDHNALLNFSANKHIDHTAVAVNTSANSGLAGGGDISASRSLVVDVTNATSKASPTGADSVLIADSAAGGALKKATLSSIITGISGNSYETDWTSGTSFTATHNLGTRSVRVTFYDNTTFETILVDTEIRTTVNAMDFTATPAPSGSGWHVMISKI